MKNSENILSVSAKRNDLWFLGDIVIDKFYLKFIREYAERFRTVNLVLGNHDHELLPGYAVQNGINLFGIVSKYKGWISHCPIHPQEFYQKKFNIHGHLHRTIVLDENGEPDKRYINVSCEQINYKPISLGQIKSKVDSL